MSWMARLYETYQVLEKNNDANQGLELYYHRRKACHIEVVLDGMGNFRRASSLIMQTVDNKGKKRLQAEQILIPVTPKSLTGKTSGAAPSPLADQISYIAKDYCRFLPIADEKSILKKQTFFNSYINLLTEWDKSHFSHPKVSAIRKYVERGSLIDDLLKNQLLYVYLLDGKTLFIDDWSKQSDLSERDKKPALFELVAEQGQAMIRWVVEFDGDPCSTTWGDISLIQAWQNYQLESNKENGFCQLLGREAFLTSTHQKSIISSVPQAKLISTPVDPSYLTYQGRFVDEFQACSISFEVSNKAHNALRWLIPRQGYKLSGSSVLIAWAISGSPIPEPMEDIDFDNFDEIELTIEPETQEIDHSRDLGQSFASALQRYIRGYRAQLNPTENIIIMSLDSATPGRMAVTYYRDFFAKDYLDHIEQWHSQFAWRQRVTKEIEQGNGKKPKTFMKWLVSAPSTWSILNTAYGDIIKSNAAIKNSFYNRLLPCITEGRALPLDLVELCLRHACNPLSGEHWEWERNLGVACAMFRGYSNRHPIPSQRKDYAMSLELNNTSRDYLYGRLLAIAERIEEIALNVAGENRPTNAMRLMQRFADRPYSTWLTLYKQLQPYMQRLQNSRTGFLVNCKKELDEVTNLFSSQDFTNDKRLSGEFLLAYHCQRLALRDKSDT